MAAVTFESPWTRLPPPVASMSAAVAEVGLDHRAPDIGRRVDGENNAADLPFQRCGCCHPFEQGVNGHRRPGNRHLVTEHSNGDQRIEGARGFGPDEIGSHRLGQGRGAGQQFCT
jgi:hypothetical protein